MTCQNVQSNLGAYFDRELSEADRSDMKAHLTQCVSCRTEYALFKHSLAALHGLSQALPVKVTGEFETTVMREILSRREREELKAASTREPAKGAGAAAPDRPRPGSGPLAAVERARPATGTARRETGPVPRPAGPREVPEGRGLLRPVPLWIAVAAAAVTLLAAVVYFTASDQKLNDDNRDLAERLSRFVEVDGHAVSREDRGKIEQGLILYRNKWQTRDQVLQAEGFAQIAGRWINLKDIERMQEGRIWYRDRWLPGPELLASLMHDEGWEKRGSEWVPTGRPVAAAPAPAPAPAPADGADRDRVLREAGLERIDGQWIPVEYREKLARGMLLFEGKWRTREEVRETLLREAGFLLRDGRWTAPGGEEDQPRGARGGDPPRNAPTVVSAPADTAAPVNPVTRALHGLSIGAAVEVPGATLHTLLFPGPAAGLAYATLPEALAAGTAEVRDEGAFARIRFRNAGTEDLLLLAGEVLAGGDFDRIVAEDAVLPAGAAASLAVLCAEPERSGGRGNRQFRSTPLLAPTGLRELLAAGGGPGDVWARLTRQTGLLSDPPPTPTLAELGGVERVRARIAAISRSPFRDLLAREARLAGVAFGVGDRLVGVDLFGSNALLAQAFPRLAQSIAVESLLREHDGTAPTLGRNTAAGIRAFLESLFDDAWTTAEPGAGTRTRAYRVTREGRTLGAALVLDARLLHAAFFAAPGEGNGATDRPAGYAVPADKLKKLIAETEKGMAGAPAAERARRVASLARIPGDLILDALARHLQDADDDVRAAAAEGLGRGMDPRAVPVLLAAIDRAKRAPRVLRAVLAALGRLADDRAADEVAKLTNHNDVDIVRASIEALAGILRQSKSEAVLDKQIPKLISFMEYIYQHERELNPAACPTHYQYEALAKPLREAMAKITGQDYPGAAEYRNWWNREKTAFLKSRAIH